MKRLTKVAVAVLMGIMLAFAMIGCTTQSESSASSSSSSSSSAASSSSSSSNSSSAATTADLGNAVVVYFSATGSTAKVADEIATATDAATFELIPVETYTSEDLAYSDGTSRVSREHADASLQIVELESTTVPNWDSYDTVFIGYPIWWGGAAWPVDGFVTSNDFTGKTVIPFCTSASSGMGNSGSDLEELAGTGNWLAGQRFASNATADAVQSWIDSL